ncbi:hypothetical protein TWF730_000847 [Orbilia blumenaviensis]|uniref:Cysteine-rich transmembrane CYSTM domain-containing protein n=1 Tax=Orbilia blumenaviensis TaxID=1796055 RepID=A0AAV9VQX4_9PEZI
MSQPLREQENHNASGEKENTPAPAYESLPPMSNATPSQNQQDGTNAQDAKRLAEDKKEEEEKSKAVAGCCTGCLFAQCIMGMLTCCTGC